jgi:hypothetical protein
MQPKIRIQGDTSIRGVGDDPTEQATETEKPKPVKRKASPRARPSRPSKTSTSPSSSESSRSSTSSWPPRRPSARTRKSQNQISSKSQTPTLTLIRALYRKLKPRAPSDRRAASSRTPRHSVVPRTAVDDRSSPFGEVAFSGRGWERFYHTGATAATSAVTTSSGNSAQRSSDKDPQALEDD